MSQPPEKTPAEINSQILSFEEFTNRSSGAPLYSNFNLFFSWDIYQNTPCYKRFAEEHPDLNAFLLEKCGQADAKKLEVNVYESLRHAEIELYNAYKIMRSYGYSDRDLFA